jgi:hypothetical protein
MTIAVTNIGTVGNSTTVATISVTVPAGGVPANALIAVIVGESGNTAGGSIADTATNSYNAATAVFNNNTTGGYGQLFYSYNSAALVSGNSITFTKTASNTGAAVSAIYATGIQVSPNPLDSAVTASVFANSSSATATSGTPGVSGELFLAISSQTSTFTFIQDSGHGWTSPPNSVSGSNLTNRSSIGGGAQVNAGAGALTFSATYSNNGPLQASVYGFKPLSGNNKSLTITSSSSVALKRPPGKYFGVSSPSIVLMHRAMSRSVTVLSPSLISLRKGMVRSISMAQAQAVSIVKKQAKTFAVSSGQVVSLIARLAYRVTPFIVSSQSMSVRFGAVKVLAVLSLQSVAMRRAISGIIPTIVSSQVVALRNGAGKRFAVVQGQAVAMMRSLAKNISVFSGQTVNVIKSASKPIAMVSAQVVGIFPRYAKNVQVAMSMGQSVLLTTIQIVFAAPKQMLKNVIRRLFILR